jgi:Protein of unknown function (DUF3800)
MNVYIEEYGTPFGGINSETRYFVLTGTRFSANVDVRQVLAEAKLALGIPAHAEIKSHELRRRGAAESLYKLVFSGDWGDTLVSPVVLDRSEVTFESKQYPELLGLAANLAIRGLSIQTDSNINLVIDNIPSDRTENAIRRFLPKIGEIVFLKSSSSPSLQVADLLTFAAYRKLSRGDAQLFNIVRHLIGKETPLISLVGTKSKTVYVSSAPQQSILLGESIVNLRYHLNETSKAISGQNLLKPSSKNEFFTAWLVSLKPFADEDGFKVFMTGLHQYVYESSQNGKTLKPYISSESESFLHDLNRLRVYYSHDIEQDTAAGGGLKNKYQETGDIFRKLTGVPAPPSDRNGWERLRIKLLEAVEAMLQEATARIGVAR